MNGYIVIPIFTDKYFHPLHKDNNLSLLYVKQFDKEPEILTFNHSDTLTIGDIDFLKDKPIITLNKKDLLSIFPFKNVYDIDLLNYFLYNEPLNIDDIRVNVIDFFQNKYYKTNHINTIIPIYKHLEYCNLVAERIMKVWDERDKIDWESYEQYNKDAILAFYSIERNGIPVRDDVTEILGDKVKKHISDNKLYSDYFLCTAAGRPSNSFGGTNFAALEPEKRKAIIPENDYLVEFDYDAYHVRILGDLVNYEFPDGAVHEHLGKVYGGDISYEESKSLTFKYLYGYIPPEVSQLSAFFSKIEDLSNLFWKQFQEQGFVETPIYKRKIFKNNLQDIAKNKLFNYMIQAIETEYNIKTVIELQRYLYNMGTNLILYGYDSFLFDISESDNTEILDDIKQILQRKGFLVKEKQGTDYAF
jgi:hypothetical protein